MEFLKSLIFRMETIHQFLSAGVGLLIGLWILIRSKDDKKGHIPESLEKVILAVLSILFIGISLVREPMVKVPDIVGMHYAEAKYILSEEQLNYFTYDEMDDRSIVVSIFPEPGTIVKKKDNVEIKVEKWDEAEARIEELHERLKKQKVVFGDLKITFCELYAEVIEIKTQNVVHCFSKPFDVTQDMIIDLRLKNEINEVTYTDYEILDGSVIFRNIPAGFNYVLEEAIVGYISNRRTIPLNSDNMEPDSFLWERELASTVGEKRANYPYPISFYGENGKQKVNLTYMLSEDGNNWYGGYDIDDNGSSEVCLYTEPGITLWYWIFDNKSDKSWTGTFTYPDYVSEAVNMRFVLHNNGEAEAVVEKVE